MPDLHVWVSVVRYNTPIFSRGRSSDVVLFLTNGIVSKHTILCPWLNNGMEVARGCVGR